MNDSIKTADSNVSFLNLLELAANDDKEGFKRLITCTSSDINEVGLWYGHHRSSKKMSMEDRTPLMIAATYGSLDVVKFVLSLSDTNVNKSCGPDNTTALHCAASSGSVKAFEIIKLLLMGGADPELVNANGFRPIDVLFAPHNVLNSKSKLEQLLQNGDFSVNQGHKKDNLYASFEKKDYPIDPFFPDVNSGAYATDEFRMFSFKIRPCSRAYSHDWTECPFIHPGESARRRDPTKIQYSCVPCLDFRKGHCRNGDLCDYAHGVFESWLHPSQYRTRLCKDGPACSRRVCFFAHKPDELRPMGPAVVSPLGSPVAAMSAPPPIHLHGGNFPASRLSLSFNDRNLVFSPRAMVQGTYGVSSPRIELPRGIERPHLGPFSPRLAGFVDTKGKVDWSMNGFSVPEPDVSWVQSLVKESLAP